MCEKIQKLLSHLGFASRRGIEKMIKNGSISINGEKAVIGQRIHSNNLREIIIQGKVISIKNKIFPTQVIMYNKPEGEICTKHDIQNRSTVFDKLPLLNNCRWISIGRLDINTRGLLLFTNNGNLADKLMHPKYGIEREYYMRVFGEINKNTMNVLKHGVKIKNSHVSFKNIEQIKSTQLGRNTWFKGIINEGKNREIRYMWESVKCQVSRLIRIRYGNIILPKTLPLGQYIKLNSTLLKNLYNLVSFKEKIQ